MAILLKKSRKMTLKPVYFFTGKHVPTMTPFCTYRARVTPWSPVALRTVYDNQRNLDFIGDLKRFILDMAYYAEVDAENWDELEAPLQW